jgi:hypothetical protein
VKDGVDKQPQVCYNRIKEKARSQKRKGEEIMYKMAFYDNTGKRVEFCEFKVMENEEFFDKLEEVLYIMAELTPVDSRRWKKELATHGFTTFTYHGLEFSEVVYEWGSYNLEVSDI